MDEQTEDYKEPAVEPTEGDQGEPVSQDGFDPDKPVATSAPDASAQSGHPDFPGQEPEGADDGEQPETPADETPSEPEAPSEPETPADSPQSSGGFSGSGYGQ